MAGNNCTNSHLCISVEVKKGSSVLLPSTVVAINSDDTLVLFCQKCSLQKNWKLGHCQFRCGKASFVASVGH